MATTKQFDYALGLLTSLGYATGRINGCHMHLGAPTGADRGTVGEWIDGLSSDEASRLIGVLLAEGTSLSASGRPAASDDDALGRWIANDPRLERMAASEAVAASVEGSEDDPEPGDAGSDDPACSVTITPRMGRWFLLPLVAPGR